MSIGLTGLPDLPTIGVALLMVLLLPFKAAWYVLLLSRMKLRYRTALLAGLSLMNYSEFGLIVVSVGVSAGLLAPGLAGRDVDRRGTELRGRRRWSMVADI